MAAVAVFLFLLQVMTGVYLSVQTRPCFPCRCYPNLVANCTSLQLSYIPKSIPRNITTLILRHNNFATLASENFTRFQNLTILDISKNALNYVEPDALKPLKHLRVLDVSHNQRLKMTGIANITRSLENSSIEKFYMNKIVSNMAVCVIFFNNVINSLRNSSLSELHANDNRIEVFGEKTLLKFPKKLKKLYVRENRFTVGKYLLYSPDLLELEEVDISGRPGSHDPVPPKHVRQILSSLQQCDATETCNSYMDPRAPLHWMETYQGDLEHQLFIALLVNPPPKLINLIMTYAHLNFLIPDVIFGNNSLRRIDLSSNILSTWQGPVIGLEKLTYLDLSNNIARNVSRTFFLTFTGLETLNVSKNFLGFIIANDDTIEFFNTLHKLTVLDLSQNFIPMIHKNTLRGLSSLHVLDLSHNNIHSLQINIENMTELDTIICHDNHLGWLPKVLIKQLDKLSKDHNITIDLSDNPIACTCDNLLFLHWILNTDVMFGNLSDYYCIYSNGTVHDFLGVDHIAAVYEDLYANCFSHFALAIGMTGLCVFMLSAIGAGIAYRYRWKLRYWYYAARLRYWNPVIRTDADFEFTAFVSFANEDKLFVHDVLLPKIESDTNLRFLLHTVDFMPGSPIAQNIVNAVKISKRTLVILSEDFLASSWCKYELQMANMEAVTEERDVILIIMYREIESKDIPSEIFYHIKNNSFILYPPEGERDVFWKSLIETLKS